MGQSQMPKAVTPIVLERDAGKHFQVGLAEMNGWRPGMEDTHVVVMQDTWGFFGVFDGHGGQQCSAFVARRLTEELSEGPLPENDAAVKSLMLRIDQEFLDTQQPSGSTGTFVFVQLPLAGAAEQRVFLRVGNIGDSRVLLGRADGTIVEGPGTDAGLTTDHKPDNESEKERIYRTGGTVQTMMGVARVNGDLAVSRAFGDGVYKQTGGPAQEDHPVSANPEFTSLHCDPNDFLMLVCDGISEGNFPNREVVQLAAEELKTKEPAHAAAAVCRRALERNSMDNLSCMIVLFRGGEASGPKKELLPGPFTEPTHGGFRDAYAAMAEKAGMSLEAAVELRYDAVRKERAEMVKQRASKSTDEQDTEGAQDNGKETALEKLREELAIFGAGPSNALAEGSKERTNWFKTWLEHHEVQPALDPQNMTHERLMEMAEHDPQIMALAQAHGMMRSVRVAAEDELRPAMEAHAALKWDDRLKAVCGQIGKVLRDDPSDGTSEVKFEDPIRATVWMPTLCLTEDEDEEAAHFVEVPAEEVLREAIDAHPALEWQNEMSCLAGQLVQALQVDESDGTTKVKFPPPKQATAWLPSSVLTDVQAADVLEDMESDDDDDDDDDVEFQEALNHQANSEPDSDEDQDKAQIFAEPLRIVLVPAAEAVKTAIEAHATLQWEDALARICNQKASVVEDDQSNGTSCVRMQDSELAWLPTSVLKVVEDTPDVARDDENDNVKRQRTS